MHAAHTHTLLIMQINRLHNTVYHAAAAEKVNLYEKHTNTWFQSKQNPYLEKSMNTLIIKSHVQVYNLFKLTHDI